MPLVSQPRLSGTLPRAVALTVAAGFADAHIFLHVTGTFVANMSGNLVFFGMSIGEGSWRAGLRHLTAIVFFVIGSGVASWFHDRRRRDGRRVRPDLLLGVEAFLLLAVAAWVGLVGPVDGDVRIVVYPVLVMGALAMGMQNTALLRVGAVAVATTYASGSVARIGSEGALALGAGSPEDAAPHRRALPVLGAVVAAYVVGAVVAAALGASAAWMLVPALLIVAVAVVTHRTVEDEPDRPDPSPPDRP